MPPINGVVRHVLKPRYSGISWQHPAVVTLLPAVDQLDRLVRHRRGLDHLPPYSARIRATGMDGEFGGFKFAYGGKVMSEQLIKLSGLRPEHRVLDIGCGAGRLGIGLLDFLDDGNYTGFDIDDVAIDACKQTPALGKFEFVFEDLASDMYHASGTSTAAAYRFPFDDGTFDVIYLASVYTHLLADECENYAREILRLLKPGGMALVSTFLQTDRKPSNPAFSFETNVGGAFVAYPDQPRKAVSYTSDDFSRWFGQEPTFLFGQWRRDRDETIAHWQDWVLVRSPA